MKKGEVKLSEPVVYFPIDSLIPDELATRLNIKHILAGPNKDRIKTAKLRGEFSQGLRLVSTLAGSSR